MNCTDISIPQNVATSLLILLPSEFILPLDIILVLSTIILCKMVICSHINVIKIYTKLLLKSVSIFVKFSIIFSIIICVLIFPNIFPYIFILLTIFYKLFFHFIKIFINNIIIYIILVIKLVIALAKTQFLWICFTIILVVDWYYFNVIHRYDMVDFLLKYLYVEPFNLEFKLPAP